MFKKIALSFATLALAVASAASQKVTLHQDAELNGKHLKAGEYKVEVKDGTAVLKSGKEVLEAPVKVETTPSKFSVTSIRYNSEGSTPAIQEIRMGGTNTKLVFGGAALSQK
jgi:hypothetical protein